MVAELVRRSNVDSDRIVTDFQKDLQSMINTLLDVIKDSYEDVFQ